MRRHRKISLTALIGLVVVLAGAGAAYAYWTAGGDGTGTATTGSGASDLVVHQTSTVGEMGPGDVAQPLSGNFDNGNDGPTYVGIVTVSIDSVTGGDGPGCTAGDYILDDPVMVVDDEVAAGVAVGAWTGATLKFDNSTTVNQDDCKNATVNLEYEVSAELP